MQPDHSALERRGKLASLAGWLIALAAVLPLLPTLRAAFVYDDTTIIRDNPLLRGWESLARVWGAPYWPTTGVDVSGLYRPLHVAILAALWNVGGGAAWPFHLYALTLYAVVALALWWMLRRGVGAFAAGVGAVWFATHPLHVEAVASVANSAELLVVGCTIALTWLLRRAASDGAGRAAGREWRIAFGVAVLTAAAVLSKESGLLALPIAAFTAWGWHAPQTPRRADSGRDRRRLWLAGGAALAVALVARAVVLGAPVARVSIAAPGLDVLTPAQRVPAMLSLWPRIAQMIVWPGPLAPYYGPTILPANRGALAALAVLSAFAVAALALLLARRGDRRPLIALAWAALAYLPASNLLTATGQLIAAPTVAPNRVRSAMSWPGRSTACRGARTSRWCSLPRSPSAAIRSRACATPSPGRVTERCGSTSSRCHLRNLAGISCSASMRASVATPRARWPCSRAPSRWSRARGATGSSTGRRCTLRDAMRKRRRCSRRSSPTATCAASHSSWRCISTPSGARTAQRPWWPKGCGCSARNRRRPCRCTSVPLTSSWAISSRLIPHTAQGSERRRTTRSSSRGARPWSGG